MRAPDFEHWRQIPLDVEHYDYLRLSPWKKFWSNFFLTLATGILFVLDHLVLGLRVEGRENLKKAGNGGAVTVCNHVHWLDCTFLLQAQWPRRQYFISLQSNMQLPFIRHLLFVARCMPVPQDRKLLRTFSDAMDSALRAGGIVNIYPEGWLIPYCDALRDFKNGAFSHAKDANVPVVPMCITYRKGRGLWRFKRRPCMTLHILPPVFPDPAASRAAETVRLRETCKAAMEACIRENSAVQAENAPPVPMS